MKTWDAAVREKLFEADEKTRKVIDLERMIMELSAMAADLEREIWAEECRTGVRDPSDVAYSMLAKAATRRRDNLRHSVREFTARAEMARVERDAALAALARAEARARLDKVREERPVRAKRRAYGAPFRLRLLGS